MIEYVYSYLNVINDTRYTFQNFRSVSLSFPCVFVKIYESSTCVEIYAFCFFQQFALIEYLNT